MTDFEKLKNVLDDLDIGYDIRILDNHQIISLTAKKNNNVLGYTDYSAEFIFDNHGNSENVEISGDS